jgi:hypothetical protein
MHRTTTLMLALSASFLLGACGGSSSLSADTDVSVPDSALASPQAYTNYVASLPVDDRGEPVNVDKAATPPTSDTTEPVAVN